MMLNEKKLVVVDLLYPVSDRVSLVVVETESLERGLDDICSHSLPSESYILRMDVTC